MLFLVGEVTPFTVASALEVVTKLFTASISWVSSVAGTIVGNPILLIFCILPLVGLGVGLFKRLISVK